MTSQVEYSDLWDQGGADLDLLQTAYSNTDQYTEPGPGDSPAYSHSQSPASIDSCDNMDGMNNPYYANSMGETPLNNRYTQLALLLVSQSQGQNLSREEEEKRRVRRERNKVAATKCREKRKAHSVYVRHEYGKVTDTTKQLEDQISSLRRERDELMRILDSHECCIPNQQQQPLVQQQQHQLQQHHVQQAHEQLMQLHHEQQNQQLRQLFIKSEPGFQME